ncbi:hypothetical protein [Bianquea renquensis]|jgi:hypothetical protein|uniref:Uncharacterized protein n=1 Tax=Bianquea renquensis TaxID=2763661 RepID=A0A926DN57_9FIRM|nr:hypothetical protein [Bianquea renquensis]MBC8542065.1 hypothetical protein [Bianquea renquensis]
MKKIKKVVSLMLLTFIVASVVAVPVMAATDPPYSYGWLMPAEFKGSARSTALMEKTSAYTTPYVNPSINTLPTAYYLSPARLSTINATDEITLNAPGKRNFTWRSGYGGVGQSYCLTAYPNMNGDWDEYTIRGTWSH